MGEHDIGWIKDRIAKLSNVRIPNTVEIITDTTEFMDIYRGQVLYLNGSHFLVTGNIYESRFGMSDEPKYWVKKAIELETGDQKIVKLVYHEEFQVRVGPLLIRCYREPRKETRVLELVEGNSHFMQGRGLFDEQGNEVRAIDFIRGKSLYNHIFLEMKLSHEDYFYTVFPQILEKFIDCFNAVSILHDNDLCHGDIRNDHILIDQETGVYRWIDFDLTQDFSDFDIWSLGNVLLFCSGMGTRTYHEVLQSPDFSDATKNSLTSDDASAFYEHRIMNLKKLYPYIPDRLNDILLHFTLNTTTFYEKVSQITADMGEALSVLEGV
jgi:serine/threonine protein kinase